MRKEDLYIIRPMKKEDEPLIFPTWLQGLSYGNTFFSQITNQKKFHADYRKVLEQILNAKTTTTLCAVLKDDEDVILGYSVFTGPTLHWIYVKQAFRRVGIARSLLPNPIDTVTHLTSLGLQIKPKEWAFDPFKL